MSLIFSESDGLSFIHFCELYYTLSNETTKYFYSGSAVFYTTDGGGALTTENILDLGGQIIASKRFPDPDEVGSPFANKYFFYNYDIRGSVTNIVGPDGNLVTGYGYDEFGNQERKGDTSFLNEVTFTGSVSDTSTGMHYMNARYYNPSTGRFLTQDSYTGNPYDPWTQNLYAYCGNNPVNFVDPTGHSFWSFLSDAFTVVAVVATVVAVGAAIVATGGTAAFAFAGVAMSAAATTTAVTVGTIATTTAIVSTAAAATSSIIEAREVKEPARRREFNNRKDAEEAAKKAGKGKEPINHPHGHKGNPRPHFHPDVKPPHYPKPPKMPTPHDHYFYPRGFYYSPGMYKKEEK